jgi:hypothetical protein
MIAVVAVTLAAIYFGVLGDFGAWFRRYDAWQLGQLLIALVLLGRVSPSLFTQPPRKEVPRSSHRAGAAGITSVVQRVGTR